jgi:hypothetical protein
MTQNLMQAVEGLSGVAAGVFVSGVWQGVVLAAGVGLCLRLVPRTTAAVRFVLWSAVFLVLALLPFVRNGAVRMAGRAAAAHSPVHVDVRWSFAIAAIWVLLSVVRAGNLGISAVQLRRIWKRATPVEDGWFGSEGSASGLRRAQLCTSEDVDCPSVIGFFSPRVLIPAELYGRLTKTELEQIVLHEMGHLRRADDWINLLQKLGLVLFPLNPALMWIEKRLCFERELACDDGVLRLTQAPKAYATCLTTLAELKLNRRRLSLTLGAWGRRSELSRRVYRILRRGEGMSRMQAGVVFGALVLGLFGGAAELSQCPQLVSFSQAPMALQGQAAVQPAGGYQDVVYRPSTGAAHETLLKAAMPSLETGSKMTGQAQGVQPRQAKARPVHRVCRAALQGTVQRISVNSMRSSNQTHQWVMLTSWEESGARMVVTVAREQTFESSYAAVPTAGGWLVFQL